jgi:hypothetical protein
VNEYPYLAGLTLAGVRACAVEAERLFQQDPDVVPARTAAAWGRLAELMESVAAAAVSDLGPEAMSSWVSELGFSQTRRTWDDDWPRDRAALNAARDVRKHER